MREREGAKSESARVETLANEFRACSVRGIDEIPEEIVVARGLNLVAAWCVAANAVCATACEHAIYYLGN